MIRKEINGRYLTGERLPSAPLFVGLFSQPSPDPTRIAQGIMSTHP
jgi:hypothetical protein